MTDDHILYPYLADHVFEHGQVPPGNLMPPIWPDGVGDGPGVLRDVGLYLSGYGERDEERVRWRLVAIAEHLRFGLARRWPRIGAPFAKLAITLVGDAQETTAPSMLEEVCDVEVPVSPKQLAGGWMGQPLPKVFRSRVREAVQSGVARVAETLAWDSRGFLDVLATPLQPIELRHLAISTPERRLTVFYDIDDEQARVLAVVRDGRGHVVHEDIVARPPVARPIPLQFFFDARSVEVVRGNAYFLDADGDLVGQILVD